MQIGITIKQWFPPGVIVAFSRRHAPKSGDIFGRHSGREFAAHVGVRDAVKPPRGRGTAPPQQRIIQPKTSTMQRWRNSALKLTYHCNTRLIKYCSKQGEDRGDA